MLAAEIELFPIGSIILADTDTGTLWAILTFNLIPTGLYASSSL